MSNETVVHCGKESGKDKCVYNQDGYCQKNEIKIDNNNQCISEKERV